MKAAIWAGVASPSITSVMTAIISASRRFSPRTALAIASLIMRRTPFSCRCILRKFRMIRFPPGVRIDSG